jgi:hypothetical protein
VPSPKNNRKGANNTNLNVGTLYNLPPNAPRKNKNNTNFPPNAPRKRSLLGRIGGAIKYGAGATLGGIAYVGQRSAQRGFNLTGFKTRTNPTFNKNKNTTQSNVNAAKGHREAFGN